MLQRTKTADSCLLCLNGAKVFIPPILAWL